MIFRFAQRWASALWIAELMHSLALARSRLEEESSQRLRTERDRLSAAIENIPQGILLLDNKQRVLLANKRFNHIYGLSPSQTAVGVSGLEVIRACRASGSRVLSEMPLCSAPEMAVA